MNTQPQQSREKKRAQFSDAPRAKSHATPILVAVLLAAVAVGAYFVFGPSSKGEVATADRSGDMRIPLADLSEQAKFFDYRLPDNKSIRFFAMKTSDGQYRAALDACDVCYAHKKGYKQDGDQMVCQNCGLPFACSRIGQMAGGCNPVALTGAVEGDKLVIKAAELQGGEKYF